MELKEILRQYEEASGQRINLQKFATFFGKGTHDDMKGQLQNTLGIHNEALGERYLGLPTLVGRSKDGTFKYVTECSKGKVNGLKGQGLSKAAREVLVKSILQATPTYSMSCLHLAKKMCRNLTSISAKLWRGRQMVIGRCIGSRGRRCARQRGMVGLAFGIQRLSTKLSWPNRHGGSYNVQRRCVHEF